MPKGQIAWNKGIPCPKEVREKISKTKKQVFGKNHNRWNGGVRKHTSGYIQQLARNHPYKMKSGYVFQHRLVVEKYLGRYLLPCESVHHIGKKDDNSPNKLMAFSSESSHQRFHHNPSNINFGEIIFDGRILSKN